MMLSCQTDECIEMREDNMRDLRYVFREHITHKNIDTLSHERLFVGFMEGIENLLMYDEDDYINNSFVAEWTITECWKRLHELYKEQILAAFPYMENCVEYSNYYILFEHSIAHYEFNFNTFKRVTTLERAEIVKRAQIKSLKEELAMKVMHPDRIEKLINKYGIDEVMESF